MCNLYSSTDPSLYEHQTRSIRLQGAVTSVRLEREGYGVPQFINQLYSEVILRRGEVGNLASLLRVVCTVYLTHGRQSARTLELLAMPARQRRGAASNAQA